MVERRTLNPTVRVRILDPQPTLGNSSTGRALDSDSKGCGFETYFPNQKIWSSALEYGNSKVCKT
jgi:hypothetical protein